MTRQLGSDDHNLSVTPPHQLSVTYNTSRIFARLNLDTPLLLFQFKANFSFAACHPPLVIFMWMDDTLNLSFRRPTITMADDAEAGFTVLRLLAEWHLKIQRNKIESKTERRGAVVVFVRVTRSTTTFGFFRQLHHRRLPPHNEVIRFQSLRYFIRVAITVNSGCQHLLLARRLNEPLQGCQCFGYSRCFTFWRQDSLVGAWPTNCFTLIVTGWSFLLSWWFS